MSRADENMKIELNIYSVISSQHISSGGKREFLGENVNSKYYINKYIKAYFKPRKTGVPK